MTVIYRKTLKGVEEVALKTFGLSPRLRPYLLLADGKLNLDELKKKHSILLPSLEIVMNTLVEQGFLEEVSETVPATNVVSIGELRVANGVSVPTSSSVGGPTLAPMPQAVPASPTTPAPQMEADQIKLQMMRDVIQALGPDSTQVVIKIRACTSINDLFVTMMGVKKIIAMYAGDSAAEKFEIRYRHLASF